MDENGPMLILRDLTAAYLPKVQIQNLFGFGQGSPTDQPLDLAPGTGDARLRCFARGSFACADFATDLAHGKTIMIAKSTISDEFHNSMTAHRVRKGIKTARKLAEAGLGQASLTPAVCLAKSLA